MEVSSTILKVFGMTRPGIEPRSPGLLVNTLPTRQWGSMCKLSFKLSKTENNIDILLYQIYLPRLDENKTGSLA